MKIITVDELDKIDDLEHFAIRLEHIDYINVKLMQQLIKKIEKFRCVGDHEHGREVGQVFPAHMLTFQRLRRV